MSIAPWFAMYLMLSLVVRGPIKTRFVAKSTIMASARKLPAGARKALNYYAVNLKDIIIG